MATYDGIVVSECLTTGAETLHQEVIDLIQWVIPIIDSVLVITNSVESYLPVDGDHREMDALSRCGTVY